MVATNDGGGERRTHLKVQCWVWVKRKEEEGEWSLPQLASTHSRGWGQIQPDTAALELLPSAESTQTIHITN